MEKLILVLHIPIGKSLEGQKLDKIQSVNLVNAYDFNALNKNKINLVNQISIIVTLESIPEIIIPINEQFSQGFLIFSKSNYIYCIIY